MHEAQQPPAEVADPIYSETRPTRWPAPEGSHVTVTARQGAPDGDVAITWQRDDLAEKGERAALLVLTVDDLRGIVAAIDARRN